MEALRYQVERLQLALQSVDVDATSKILDRHDAFALQAALAHTEALLHRLPSVAASLTKPNDHNSKQAMQQQPVRQRAAHQGQLIIDTIATVSAATGVSVAELRACNPRFATLPDDAALPANTYLRLRAPLAPATATPLFSSSSPPPPPSEALSQPARAAAMPGRSASQQKEFSLSPPPPPPQTAASPAKTAGRGALTPTACNKKMNAASDTDIPTASNGSPTNATSTGPSVSSLLASQPSESAMHGRSPDSACYGGSSASNDRSRGGSWAPEASSANASTISAPPPCAPMPAGPMPPPSSSTAARGLAASLACSLPQQLPAAVLPEPRPRRDGAVAQRTPPRGAAPNGAASLANSPPSPAPLPPTHGHGGKRKLGSPPPSRRPKTNRHKVPTAASASAAERATEPAALRQSREKTLTASTEPLLASTAELSPSARAQQEKQPDSYHDMFVPSSSAATISGGLGGGGGGISTSPTSSSNSPKSKSNVMTVPGGMTVITTRSKGSTGSRSPSSQPRSPARANEALRQQQQQWQQSPPPPPASTERELSLSSASASKARGENEQDARMTSLDQPQSKRYPGQLSLSQPRAGSGGSLSGVSAPSSSVSPHSGNYTYSEAGPNHPAPSPMEARAIFASLEDDATEESGGFAQQGRATSRRAGEEAEESEERGATVSVSVSNDRADSVVTAATSPPPLAKQLHPQSWQQRDSEGGVGEAAGTSKVRPAIANEPQRREGAQRSLEKNAGTENLSERHSNADATASSMRPSRGGGDDGDGDSASEEDGVELFRDDAPTPCSAVPSSLAGCYYASNVAPTLRGDAKGRRPTEEKHLTSATPIAVASLPSARTTAAQDVSMATSSTFISEPPSLHETSAVAPRQGQQGDDSNNDASLSAPGMALGEKSPPAASYNLEDGSQFSSLSHSPPRDGGSGGESSARKPDAAIEANSPPPCLSPAPVLSSFSAPKSTSHARLLGKQRQRSSSAPTFSHSAERSNGRDNRYAEPADLSEEDYGTGVEFAPDDGDNDDETRTSGDEDGGYPASSTAHETDLRNGRKVEWDEDGDDDDEEYDTIAGIAETYNVTVGEVMRWNPYLAAYGPQDPLPPDLPIVLPVPSAENTEGGSDGDMSTPEANVEPWIEGTPSPVPTRPAL